VHDQRRDDRSRKRRDVVEPVWLRLQRAEHGRALRDARLELDSLSDARLQLLLHRLDRRALERTEAHLLAQYLLGVGAVQLQLPQGALALLLLCNLGCLRTLAHRSRPLPSGCLCLRRWLQSLQPYLLKLGLKLGLEALDIIELLSGCPLVVLGELRHQPVDASLQQVANHLAPAAGTDY
jgi:hypothetical protein